MTKLFMGCMCLLCVCIQGKAQDGKSLEMGLGSGISIYQGDLSPNRLGSLRRAGLGLQIYGNYVFHPAFSIRANYSFALLQENDKNYAYDYKPHRNFFFQTAVNEFSLQFVYNFLQNNGDELYEERRLVPYAFAGLGVAHLNVNRDWSGFDYSWSNWQSWVRPGLAADSAYALPKYILTIPVGLGFRYFIGENIALFAEGSHRFMSNEYLDGFSKSANPDRKDAFTTFTAGIIFRRPSSFQ